MRLFSQFQIAGKILTVRYKVLANMVYAPPLWVAGEIGLLRHFCRNLATNESLWSKIEEEVGETLEQAVPAFAQEDSRHAGELFKKEASMGQWAKKADGSIIPVWIDHVER